MWTQTWTWNAQSKRNLNHFSSNTYDCIYQASNIFMLEASRLGFLRLTNPLNSTNLTQTISNGWVLIIDQNFPYHFLRSSMYHNLKSALCLLLTVIPHLILTACYCYFQALKLYTLKISRLEATRLVADPLILTNPIDLT